jgi:glycosyltransferase involved in cell wall biosynthesis
MKITFVLPPVNMSGGIRVASIYARRLTELGHSVVAVSPPLPPPSLRARFRRPFALSDSRAIPKSHFDGADFDHRVIDRWRPIVDDDVPAADAVIATWWETAEWVARLSPAKGVKFHFVQGHEVFDWLPVERCKASYRLPLHKIVVAQWLKTIMERDYGNATVDVVPNSVDHKQFFAPPRGMHPRPTVGFLYSTAALKGVDITLQVVGELRARVSNLHVVSFGDQAPPAGLLNSVEFHLSPAQSALREIYASCDVWMTASRSEGFNLPAMEAMACRTPVVSTRTGWPEESIVDGANGWCVDVDNVQALTDAAAQVLLQTDQEWRAMSERAFVTVKHSSWDESVKQFESALVRQLDKLGTSCPAPRQATP